MSRLWTTAVRELMGYFFSPVGYLVAVLLYLFRGLEVTARLKRLAESGSDVEQFSSMYVLTGSSVITMVLVPPILTMRCFAEERRTGSLEVLLTAPVRSWEVVGGKWLAAFVYFCLLWGPTLLVLEVLTTGPYLDTAVPLGPVLAGYLGIALVGAMLLAVGCFTSSLTDNQLLASLSAMLFGYALLHGPSLLGIRPDEAEGSVWRALYDQTSVYTHLNDWFARGLIDTSHLVFYVAGTAFFLFLTTRALEARRW